VINANIIAPLVHLLQTAEFDIKKEAAWAISNATSGGTHDQIKYGNISFLFIFTCCVISSSFFPFSRKLSYSIGNSMKCRYLVAQGCIKPLCDLLVCPDPRIVTVCLEGLENILKVGEAEKNLGAGDVNVYAQMIDDAEGLDKIENLQSHDNTEIYEKAVKMLESYWLEEEDDAMPSGDNPQNGFNFGNQPSVPSGGFNFG
jgi:importin subunit alpha-6/7